MKIEAQGLGDLPKVVEGFGQVFHHPQLIRFDGEMGAGKTTLITAICRTLGVTEEVSSPTFSIVNEYHGEHGIKIYHFDFYRLEHFEEALDFGIEEYLDEPGVWCFLEWAERVEELLPNKMGHVQISKVENGRSILIEA